MGGGGYDPRQRPARPRGRTTDHQEDPITSDVGTHRSAKAASWVYSEEFVPEDEVLLRARDRAAELGCPAVLPGVGAVLQVLAASLAARAVVEIGTGTGVASIWLLRGMPADGVLTTIDVEVEHQRAAKAAFAEEGVPASRTRTIPGRASDVLPASPTPRTTSSSSGRTSTATPSTWSRGCASCARAACWRSTARCPTTVSPTPRGATRSRRSSGRSAGLRSDERVLPALLPSGDGLLLAVRR